MDRLSSMHWNQNTSIASRNFDQMDQRASLFNIVAEMSAMPNYLLDNKKIHKRTN